MVVSQNKGTPIQTPKYYDPYYRNPQGTPNFGEAHILIVPQRVEGYCLNDREQKGKHMEHEMELGAVWGLELRRKRVLATPALK